MQTPLAISFTQKIENQSYKFSIKEFIRNLIRPVKNLYNNSLVAQKSSPVVERYEFRNGTFVKLADIDEGSSSVALAISLTKE